MTHIIYPDQKTLNHAAAEFIVQQAKLSISDHGRFSVALSGGGTPRKVYELLALPPLREEIPWADVHVFWGDERCVPLDDPQSNALMAKKAFLDHVPIPSVQIHFINCSESPENAAMQYEEQLRAYFAGAPPRFDLILLGLGENGHTASLFPYTPVLEETERWAAAVYITEQALYRVTLTLPIINRAAVTAFVVSGVSKSQVLEEVMEGHEDPSRLPAQLIQPQHNGGRLYWLLDAAAASRLDLSRELPQS